MKKLFWASTLLAGLLLTGCGPNTKTTGNVGATATSNSICPVGYWYSNGQCYNGNNATGAGDFLNNGMYSDNYSNTTTLRITNIEAMKKLFKQGMGVCDRAANNYGQANCEAYIQGYTDIILLLPSTTSGTALATIIARPKQDPYFNFYGQLPNGRGLLGLALGWITGIYIPDYSYYQGAYRNPLQIQMAVSPINQNQGFQATGYGDAWTGLNQTMVTLQVANGSVNSTNVSYTLFIGNTAAAQGTMKRCQAANCGL
ncbi:hypothetical protein [Pseudobdellovibrio exovorus]|uniref:Lipoprotein n=1 Tax=Pseudobdellovibrio exovorus JSS TaxID=1184267 RepID=M4VCX1_9BACT|nr:hypothetical protein [Pseudobdellovibrio exovorus]AGH96335.1 hypothetical protein A11Q_2119 [Pseudobdellovibrio exovorus JSS]